MSGRHKRRETDYLRIALEEDAGFPSVTTGLERFRFVHQALPKIDLMDVNRPAVFLGKRQRHPPLLIRGLFLGQTLPYLTSPWHLSEFVEMGNSSFELCPKFTILSEGRKCYVLKEE